MSADVLGIFAKRPVAGLVKTRLAAETSSEWAAKVAEAFLSDTLDRFATVTVRRVVAFSPANSQSFFAEFAAGRYDLMPQGEGHLGERMKRFVEWHLSQNANRVVLVGTDSPSLPIEYVEDAFRALDSSDVVVGPATDGGYYLIGCRRRVPPIFANVDWSGPRVLSQTIARLADWDGSLFLLPPWYDVDTFADYCMLRGHLQAMARAGLAIKLPHTEKIPSPPLKTQDFPE
ncbi:MAG: hypothetical protein KatS3mg105_2985 [Gemmatales bacterium]|nr:MAG: hypothetical protein KatS3mg105_2985 [Gemmatales bacterium]